jgi:hypothetical protein
MFFLLLVAFPGNAAEVDGSSTGLELMPVPNQSAICVGSACPAHAGSSAPQRIAPYAGCLPGACRGASSSPP